MNRILATVGTLALLTTLAACGGQEDDSPKPAAESSAPSESGSDTPGGTGQGSSEGSGEGSAKGSAGGTAKGASTSAEGTMKAYLQASIDKDAARLCSLFGTAKGPVREEKETLQTCTDMYASILEVKQGEEGWEDVGTIIEESTQALADGPSSSEVKDDTASFTYTALTEGRPVELVRHGKEWFIKVD